MQKNQLYLQFNDNNKEIEFDLNKNTVFFGNNGQGKTRILKTINSLYVLAKEKKTGNFSKIIDSMNLETLKINDVNYNELFSVNENLKETEKREIILFIRNSKKVFEKLHSLLLEIPEENFYDVQGRLNYNRILNYLNNCIDLNDIRFNSRGFNRWLNDTYILIARLRNKNKHMIEFDTIINEEFYLTYIEEALNLISYLKEKYQFSAINSEDEELISRLEQEKGSILKKLSIKSAHYITTDNIEITGISNKIEVAIDQINNDLKNYFWHKSTNLDSSLHELETIMVKRNKFYSKIEKFNSVIGKYTDIKVDMENINELKFIKNTEEMDFEKLSSGERKISFLFLEILFNDVDIFLIDEPELSLSLNFQNKIITDLHILTKDKTLFIATHAPYIYEDFIAIEGNISKEV
ncbi:AAA family ATPase [Oceanobacillus sp. CF4.6]|uniref:AAA family ATPase n=1 Tax=Oceanobacillus sp. CF4.6 TaxID=3373080 RepID=UPI003EE63A2B